VKYSVRFPSGSIEKHFRKELLTVQNDRLKEDIMSDVLNLSSNPYPYNQNNPKYFKKIKPPIEFYQMTAAYRIRVGDFRVLYDVDDSRKIVWILALRRRSEKTYR